MFKVFALFMQIFIIIGHLNLINRHNTSRINHSFNFQQKYTNQNIDFNPEVLEKKNDILDRIFCLRPKNGFFHVRLNATELFFTNVRLCSGMHNFYGTVKKSEKCLNNAKSYGFTCYNTSATNYVKECSFIFCQDDEHFGEGVISCDDQK